MKRHLRYLAGLTVMLLPFISQCGGTSGGGASDGMSQTLAKTALSGAVSDLDLETMSFELDGQEVDFSNATFEGGTEDDLANGEDVQVEGSLGSDNVLSAVEVKFEDEADMEAGKVKIRANVDAVDAEVGTITLQGLQPLVVKVDATTTQFVGLGSLAELASGNHVKIKAVIDGASGQLLATQVKLKHVQPKEKIAVKVDVENIDMTAMTLQVAGMVLEFAQIENFFLERGITISIADILSGAEIGDEVSVKGSLDLSTGAIMLKAIEVEKGTETDEPEDESEIEGPEDQQLQ